MSNHLAERGSYRKHKAVLIALVVSITLALLTGSLMPAMYKNMLHTRGRFHSWLHAVAFGGLAFVAARSTRSDTLRALLLVGTLAFGFGVEVLEHVQYKGALEWRDVLVDAIGISVATLFALLLDR